MALFARIYMDAGRV